MHHPDAQRGGVVGIVDPHDLTVFLDLPRFRLIQAEQHAHQGRFARAVLAQKRVDLPSPQLEGDIIIGDDTGKFFGDMEHLDDVLSFHNPHPAPFIEYGLII